MRFQIALLVAATACNTDGVKYSNLHPDADALSDAAAVDGSPASAPDAAATDEPPATSFDVAYINEWYIGVDSTHLGQYEWVRIVNTGDEPIDLSTGRFTDVHSKHPAINVSLEWQGIVDGIIDPGYAAGKLTSAANGKIVSSGLMTEPAQYTTYGLVKLRVDDLPPNGTWLCIDFEGTLVIGDERPGRATLTIKTCLSGTGTHQTPNTAGRASSSPVPR